MTRPLRCAIDARDADAPISDVRDPMTNPTKRGEQSKRGEQCTQALSVELVPSYT